MLNPMMPSEVAVKSVPHQSLPSLVGLFRLREFNAPAVVVRLHNVAQIVNIILNAIFIVGGFTNGVTTGILILLLTCVWTILEAALIRVVAELALSVLMIPMLLAKSDSRGVGGEVGMQDLAAFGQAAV